DRIWRIWDITTGDVLLAQPAINVVPPPKVKTDTPVFFTPHVTFSADRRLIAFCLDSEVIQIWSKETGQIIRTFREPPRTMSNVQISADGKRLAWVTNFNSIKVADTATGEVLLLLRGDQTPIGKLLFTPDGERLVSGSANGSISFWE